ncbi:MAG: hypothetical protein VZS44_04370 [Bacilli bacterium]|nr:hypothetical protein [Bacilli bacterium]
MSKGKKENFEKRRKGVETLFDIIFLIILIETIAYLCLGYVKNNPSYFVSLLIVTCCMFAAVILARKGHIAAGIIGIIIAVIQVLGGNLISLGIGLLLGTDSIMYLIDYNKK